MSLSGVCTITLTPFTEEGDVDLESIDSLAGLYLDSGVHGLTILGIMGEAHKLSDAERSMVMERYIEAAGERVPVVVGCSAMATKVTAKRAREAEDAGSDYGELALLRRSAALEIVGTGHSSDSLAATPTARRPECPP